VPWVSASLLRARDPYPLDEIYFEIALPAIHALRRLGLRPRRHSAQRWSFMCPVCREPGSGTLLARPDGIAVVCRFGCSRSRIKVLLEAAAW
jgi:hypothetical protein